MTAIVTDSTSDLDAAEASAAGITVVPLFVNFGDARFRDNVDLTHDEFFTRMASNKELPTTAQPTPAMFEDAFRPAVERGEAIVCLTITASLSGTINAATTAAAAFPGAEIHIVDSETVAGGLALLAQHAAELARGGASTHEILAALARDRSVLRGFFALPDFSHVVRTGRVSRAQAFIGSALKITPVMRLDNGAIQDFARVRTFTRALDTMAEAVAAEANAADGARISIIHARADASLERLRTNIRSRLTREPLVFQEFVAGPVIGTHAGPGAIGAFVIRG
jgi:DegV family protein with EDD domain